MHYYHYDEEISSNKLSHVSLFRIFIFCAILTSFSQVFAGSNQTTSNKQGGIPLAPVSRVMDGTAHRYGVIDSLQTACLNANYVTMNVAGTYGRVMGSTAPISYVLKFTFKAPNKLWAELTETIGQTSSLRRLVSDGKTFMVFHKASNEFFTTPACTDKISFLTQIQPYIINEEGFLLHGLRGDWHWFETIPLKQIGTQVLNSKIYNNYESNINGVVTGTVSLRKKEHEYYRFSLSQETTLPKKMEVSYTHLTAGQFWYGNFLSEFDFDSTPVDTMFRLTFPRNAKATFKPL